MRSGPVDGILNVDKPYGITSMDIVRRIKRASGVKRVGHGGTLDPVATGVVPICFGQATRMMEYLVSSTKDYKTTIELGVTTDTYDALGQVTARADPSHVDLDSLQNAIASFKGVIKQVPPMFSALKRDGKRLYELARAGIEVDREPRRVEVFAADLLDWSPPLVTLRVRCGRGFYMRSCAHDLGQALGCGGHLKSLVRTRAGPFEISDSVTLPDAEHMLADESWPTLLHTPDVVLRTMRAIVVGKRLEDMINGGRPLPSGVRIPSSKPGEQCRAYSVDGRFLAILGFQAAQQQWQPDKVFSVAYPEPILSR